MAATYGVQCWDCEVLDEDGREAGGFSGELARQHLGGPNTGLSRGELRRALRTLRSHGWDDVSLYVWREDGADG